MHKDPFYKSLGYAISGIIQCIQKERNIKIHLVFMFLVIICGFLFRLSITNTRSSVFVVWTRYFFRVSQYCY